MLRVVVYGILGLAILLLLSLCVPGYVAYKDNQHIEGLKPLAEGIQSSLKAYFENNSSHKYPESISNYESLRKIVNDQRIIFLKDQYETTIRNIHYESKNGKNYFLIIEADITSQSKFILITPGGVTNFTRVAVKVPPDINKITNTQIIRLLTNIDNDLINNNIDHVLDNYSSSAKLNIRQTIYKNGKTEGETNYTNLRSYKKALTETRAKLSISSRKRDDIYIFPNPQKIAVHSDVVEIGKIDGKSYKNKIRELYDIKIIDNHLSIINDTSFAFTYCSD